MSHCKRSTGDKTSQREEIGDDPFDPEDSWETGSDLHQRKDGLMEFIMETVEHFQLHVPSAAVIVVPIGIVAMSLLCCLT
ncbi:hypothetical protein AAFF_G00371840 [Aldrovandia affinis]|uniref:Uncharacterized protein n=1 Tax=Aldrovandia affinis TaxID=143900 RepID=A0AAD7SGT5_9TELE|nr:hypothetical protein AAFF_G00371840 [Aldrovandia affinis]